MRSAQARLRSVPPADPRRRDASIAAALAASPVAESQAGADAPGRAGATVGDLAAHRARPAPARRRNTAPWFAAAAAVVLLVLAFGGLLATTGRSDDDASTSSEAAGGETESRGDSVLEDDSGAAAADAAPTTTVPQPGGGQFPASPPPDASSVDGEGLAAAQQPVDLGTVDSVDELASRATDLARTGFASSGGDATQSAPTPSADEDATARRAVDACPTPRGARPEDGATLRTVAVATLDGEPVRAWLVTVGGDDRMIVVDPACEVVGRRTLG
jgi:hypothetical protein